MYERCLAGSLDFQFLEWALTLLFLYFSFWSVYNFVLLGIFIISSTTLQCLTRNFLIKFLPYLKKYYSQQFELAKLKWAILSNAVYCSCFKRRKRKIQDRMVKKGECRMNEFLVWSEGCGIPSKTETDRISRVCTLCLRNMIRSVRFARISYQTNLGNLSN